MATVTAELLPLKISFEPLENYCRARYSQFIPDVAWPERILPSYGGSPKDAILE
jgi:hypothetical protein